MCVSPLATNLPAGTSQPLRIQTRRLSGAFIALDKGMSRHALYDNGLDSEGRKSS